MINIKKTIALSAMALVLAAASWSPLKVTNPVSENLHNGMVAMLPNPATR